MPFDTELQDRLIHSLRTWDRFNAHLNACMACRLDAGRICRVAQELILDARVASAQALRIIDAPPADPREKMSRCCGGC